MSIHGEGEIPFEFPKDIGELASSEDLAMMKNLAEAILYTGSETELYSTRYITLANGYIELDEEVRLDSSGTRLFDRTGVHFYAADNEAIASANAHYNNFIEIHQSKTYSAANLALLVEDAAHDATVTPRDLGTISLAYELLLDKEYQNVLQQKAPETDAFALFSGQLDRTTLPDADIVTTVNRSTTVQTSSGEQITIHHTGYYGTLARIIETSDDPEHLPTWNIMISEKNDPSRGVQITTYLRSKPRIMLFGYTKHIPHAFIETPTEAHEKILKSEIESVSDTLLAHLTHTNQ